MKKVSVRLWSALNRFCPWDWVTANVEQGKTCPPIPPLQDGSDSRLVAINGAWDTFPENIKKAIYLIANTSQAKEVER